MQDLGPRSQHDTKQVNSHEQLSNNKCPHHHPDHVSGHQLACSLIQYNQQEMDFLKTSKERDVLTPSATSKQMETKGNADVDLLFH